MRKGMKVVDIYTGEFGTIIDAGYSWVDVQWIEEIENNVPTHRLRVYNDFDQYIK